MQKFKLTTALMLCVTASPLLAQDIVLQYMSWDPSQLEVEQSTIEAFEESHPGVIVKAQAIPSNGGYWPKLTAQAASGDLPDVMMMSSGFVQEWAQAENLLDLSSLVSDDEWTNYYEGAASVGVVNGKRVAFPQNWVAPVLFYNIDMFEAAGIEVPNADWTWDDFLKAAHALTIDENDDGRPEIFGFSLYGRYAHIEPWVFRNGGRYLNDDLSALELNEEAINALQFLTDLVNVEGVAPKPQDMEGIRQQDIFPLGMAAMWVDGSWNIANSREIVGDQFQWGIAEVPRGPDATDETVASYAWADMLAVSATSEHPELAWELIQALAGEGVEADDFLGGKVPAYIPVAESEEWLETDQLPANKGVLLDIGASTIYAGFSPGWSAWRGYAASGSGGMNGELDEVFNGRKTLDDAVTAFVEFGNDVLSRQ
ncbi:sugar ABC transporter substrate-binding protein [Pacificibacter sp. AS14]|uniref:ABC transporter substrate-binding protein n=1 Tax=Alphaproteobacteria TaxID=28211 RepID=UPI003176946B